MSQRLLNTMWIVVIATALAVGCADPAPEPTAVEATAGEPSPGATSPGSADSPSSTPEDATLPTVVVLGDSLSAGYGLDEAEAFPALVDAALRDQGRAVRMVNAGVSGDTSAGGLARLDWLLRQSPDIVVVELGANDGLRGVDLESTESNLRTIIERSSAAGARVLLAGMQIPPNYGQDYTSRFAEIFPRLAEELGVPLIPFLLEGVAGDPTLNQPDGIHPTAEGQEILAETVLAHLLPLVDAVASARPNGDTDSAPGEL